MSRRAGRQVPPGLVAAWRDRRQVRPSRCAFAPDFDAMRRALEEGCATEADRCRVLAELQAPRRGAQGRLL